MLRTYICNDTLIVMWLIHILENKLKHLFLVLVFQYCFLLTAVFLLYVKAQTRKNCLFFSALLAIFSGVYFEVKKYVIDKEISLFCAVVICMQRM
jgi:hypothetical protein